VDKIVNLDLLGEPLNWVIVFIILYALALATQYVAKSANVAGITFL